jgi:hypothetical protein
LLMFRTVRVVDVSVVRVVGISYGLCSLHFG